jgi:hypothetical protein
MTRRSSNLIRWSIFCAFILALATAALAQWQESVLYSFQGGTDGEWPLGRVVFDAAGNLYGATQAGGSLSCISFEWCGTVYQLIPPAQEGDPWTETVLHIFQGHATGDASAPLGGLVIDSAGNLYGATGYGGTGDCNVLGTFPGCGTVYELSPPTEKGGAWTETVLYNFQGGTDGYVPYGDLVSDNAGNLYGATLYGGGYGTNCGDATYPYCGTVFEVSPPKVEGGPWTEQVLYSFKGRTEAVELGDGANPNGGLIIDETGAIYGTTQIGGFNCPHNSNGGCGTAFRLSPPARRGELWSEMVIHRFIPNVDGENPLGGLAIDTNGNLYGTAHSGGPYSAGGTLFRLSPPSGNSVSWNETSVLGFNPDDNGDGPEGSLIFDPRGNLCGTTNTGSGDASRGSAYCLGPVSGNGEAQAFGMLHGFAGIPDGTSPAAGLTLGKTTNYFGTTQYGGLGTACGVGGFAGCGTVFEIWP